MQADDIRITARMTMAVDSGDYEDRNFTAIINI